MGLSGVLFYLAADVRHVHPQNLVVLLRVWPPDAPQDRVVGQHPPRVLGQQGEELVLDLGQMDSFALQTEDPLVEVYFQIQGLIDLAVGVSAAVAQSGADAGRQLVRIEGLGDIVVGPQIQCGHLFLFLVAGGDDEDGDMAPTAQLFQHLESVHVRQTQVQQDQIGTEGGRKAEPLSAGQSRGGRIAVLVQERRDIRTCVLVIFY